MLKISFRRNNFCTSLRIIIKFKFNHKVQKKTLRDKQVNYFNYPHGKINKKIICQMWLSVFQMCLNDFCRIFLFFKKKIIFFNEFSSFTNVKKKFLVKDVQMGWSSCPCNRCFKFHRPCNLQITCSTRNDCLCHSKEIRCCKIGCKDNNFENIFITST